MQTALDYRDAISEGCTFLTSFMRGRRGYTSGDVRAGIARLKCHCLQMQKLHGESDRALTELARAEAAKVVAEAEKFLTRPS